MSTMNTFIERYGELEQEVRELMSGLFSGVCGICTACCCRVDICEETTRSAFLSRLLEHQKRPKEDMDDRYGWLDVHGCTLEYGRPPVCYTYFCDELLAQLPDDESRCAVRILGRLIDYIGEDAAPGLHLVELMTPEQLDAVDLNRLDFRLEQAQSALEVIRQFTLSGRIGTADRAILDVIGIPED